MTDVLGWARETGEAADAIRALELIPARLGMLDADLGTLPAELDWFERVVAGQGYALVSPRARDKEKTGRRADSRVRALLKRVVAATGGGGGAGGGGRGGGGLRAEFGRKQLRTIVLRWTIVRIWVASYDLWVWPIQLLMSAWMHRPERSF